MSSTTCPTFCTVHSDPAWTGPHHSDPLDIAAVIEHDGIPMPVSLVLTHTATDSGEWMQVQAEETDLLDLRLDLSSAARLARAINLAAGSAMDGC